MRALVICLGLLAATPAAAFDELSNNVIAGIIISHFMKSNGACRGGPGGAVDTWKACGARDYQMRLLTLYGWCYGRDNEAGHQHRWHKCGPGSYYPLFSDE